MGKRTIRIEEMYVETKPREKGERKMNESV
jgi:hypothetical protein